MFGYFGSGSAPLIITAVCSNMTWLTLVAIKFVFVDHIGKEGVTHFLNKNHQVSFDDLQVSKEMQLELHDGHVDEFHTKADYEKRVIHQNGYGEKKQIDSMKE
jgi:hypothetical protein